MKTPIPLTKKGRPPKKGGGKLGRNEVLQTRLDGELKYQTEIAARSEKRTISSIIEIALERYLSDFTVTFQNESEPGNIFVEGIHTFSKVVWDSNEAIRFLNLAQYASSLLSVEEKLIWNIIKSEPYFWIKFSKTDDLEPNTELIKLMWNTLQVVTDADEIQHEEIEKNLLTLNKSASRKQIAALRKALDDIYCSTDSEEEDVIIVSDEEYEEEEEDGIILSDEEYEEEEEEEEVPPIKPKPTTNTKTPRSRSTKR